jgi:3-oxoacyl-[acyl-carrier-protein] synthase-3
MAYYRLPHIRIAAVASAVPTEVVKLESFADRFGADYVKKYMEQTGVRQFRKTREHQTASDLAFAAAENIIKTKGIDRDSIGALVFVAHSKDYWRPATACVLHKRLGLKKDCAAYDISLACSAVPYGLYAVGSMMETSDVERALLLVGETPQKITNPEDKSSCMLIGEGGGAFLLEKTDEMGAGISGICRSWGEGYSSIIMPGGGFRNPNAPEKEYVWKDGNKRSMYNVMMRGEDVFAFTISDVPKTIKDFLAKEGTTVDGYDCLAFHQANKFIIEMLCKKLKVSPEKMPVCLDRYGNTSAASIPMVLGDVYGGSADTGLLNVLMSGFGVGLSWGVCSAKIRSCDILPVIESDEIFEEGIINTPEDYYKLNV